MTSGATRDLVRGGGIVLVAFVLIAALVLVFGNGTADPVGDGGGAAAGAAPEDGALACIVESTGMSLPAEVRETSGLARSARDPEVFWTHNDSGDEPVLYALGADGGLAAAVRVEGARARDWEDLEAAPCAGVDGPCLYIADTGDNEAERQEVVVYAVPEPGPGEGAVSAMPLRARYPDGARDAEGVFMADGRLHLVTKGREGPIRLYRYPADTGSAGDVAVLEPVAELAPRPEHTADYVTAATASPDGEHIAIRTYRTLLVYDAGALLAGTPRAPRTFDLTPLAEPQGEAVVLGEGGEVWLTSEERGGAGPSWSRLVCEI